MSTRPTNTGLTPLEKARLELFYANQENYHRLVRERMDFFESDGSVRVERLDGSIYIMVGREFIEDTIKYFEQKDNTPWYLVCSKLMSVLREYDITIWEKTNPARSSK